MSFDEKTIRRVAFLARIDLEGEDLSPYISRLSSVMSLIETLNEVDIRGVSPLVSIVASGQKMRDDKVTTSGCSQKRILSHAPESEHNHFRVPRIIG